MQQSMHLFDNIEREFLGDNADYMSSQIITYLGNKRQLLPLIRYGVETARSELGKEKLDILDLFSGSGIVSRLMKQYACSLYVNDLETYSYVINKCYLSNRNEVCQSRLGSYFEKLNQDILDNWVCDGFIAEMYSPFNDLEIAKGERAFYTRRNAEFIDTARQQIEKLPAEIRHFYLAPLLASASVHANTSGVFKGFYKDRNGIGCFGGAGKNALSRITGSIRIDLPFFSNFNCKYRIFQEDAKLVLSEVPHVDLAYLDPPYNQHPYGSNYFMLNLISTYKKPKKVSEVSGIPTDWNRSLYNKKNFAKDELFSVIEKCDADYILVSYNSEGFISYDEMVSFLKGLGSVRVLESQYNAFRGSRNLHKRDLHVTEYLFLLKKGA